jgi:hypothetical protein
LPIGESSTIDAFKHTELLHNILINEGTTYYFENLALFGLHAEYSIKGKSSDGWVNSVLSDFDAESTTMYVSFVRLSIHKPSDCYLSLGGRTLKKTFMFPGYIINRRFQLLTTSHPSDKFPIS